MSDTIPYMFRHFFLKPNSNKLKTAEIDIIFRGYDRPTKSQIAIEPEFDLAQKRIPAYKTKSKKMTFSKFTNDIIKKISKKFSIPLSELKRPAELKPTRAALDFKAVIAQAEQLREYMDIENKIWNVVYKNYISFYLKEYSQYRHMWE